MVRKVFSVALAISFIFPAQSFATGSLDYPSAFACDGSEKFNWYCDSDDQKKQVQMAPVIPVQPIVAPQPPVKDYKQQKLEEFDKLQKDLEESRKVAIIDPSYNNIKDYITKQLAVQNMAAVFADTWKRVQWQNPELDYSNKFTVNNVGKQEMQKFIEGEKIETLKELSAQGWGLFFFYGSKCGYCHRMVPSINELVKQGMNVLPISVDGGIIEELNAPSVIDAGQAEQLQVKQTPTLYLVNSNTKKVIPIASGIAAYSDIVTRIYIIVKTKPGDNY